MTSSELIFRETLRQMESSFTVSLVATYDLQTFDHQHSVYAARHTMIEHDFSQAPVTRDGDIVGVVDVADPAAGACVHDWMRPLGARTIVSGHSSLRTLTRLLANDRTRYRLVVDSEGVTGIVTRTDLQKLPVRLLTYTYVTHLESLMAEAIERRLSEEEWLDLLSKSPVDLSQDARDALGPNVGPRTKQDLKRNQEKFRKRGDTPFLMELTQFSQKWYIAYRAFGIDLEFVSQMVGIQKFLRNPVAHGRNYVADDFQLEQLERRLCITEHWIEEFAKIANTPASLPTSSDEHTSSLESV